MTTVIVQPSRRKDKRLQATFPGRVVHFGSKGGSTYIDHGDPDVRAAWLARHAVNENWRDWRSAGALARWLLWEETTLRKAVDTLNRKQKAYRFYIK